MEMISKNVEKWDTCDRLNRKAGGWVITLCWDCSMASKYLIIWLLKSLAFCFWKNNNNNKKQGCRNVSCFWTGLEIVNSTRLGKKNPAFAHKCLRHQQFGDVFSDHAGWDNRAPCQKHEWMASIGVRRYERAHLKPEDFLAYSHSDPVEIPLVLSDSRLPLGTQGGQQHAFNG